ncbi:MAG: glycosyltransferase [Solirubrobacterales bacterium]
MRGAERTFAAIAECWPNAPIYTTLYSEVGTASSFAGRAVTTSFLQRIGARQRGFRAMLPLYPLAVRRLPVKRHDVVVSSSSAFAHGIRPGPGAVHICYSHTPFRYAWHECETALREVPSYLRPALSAALKRIQRWDLEASKRVTRYIANSSLTRERIRDFYGRDAKIVHPPVEVERFSIGEPEDFFLAVSELVPHKRVDVVLEAARRASRRVVVVGGGPELPRLRAQYSDVAQFEGRASDERLADLYQRALGLLVPNIEEFGIAAVEAQAAGRPVVAVAAGGALETVVEGKTGVLLPRGDVVEFAEAMREIDFDRFDPAAISRHASRFSLERFKRSFKAEIEMGVGQLG